MIKGFEQHRFLSNFWPSPFWYKEQWWPSVENAYQWYKVEDPEVLPLFKTISAGKAKLFGKGYKPLPTSKKIALMRDLVYQKFLQNPDLQELLIATDPEQIVEFNNWGDDFWGRIYKDGRETGKNHLGIILMDVRMNFRGEGLLW